MWYNSGIPISNLWSKAVSNTLVIVRNPIRMAVHDAINQLQIIVGAMEMGEARPALEAVRKVHDIADRLRLEIMGIKP